ncbi:MAG: glycyl-radical enzyme activating protein [Oscillospiraceae bacterium]|jgi:pyruvate formate lyase activating enzyme|nr:glycyl-radical enzyme activating protein [Oscillospiraceae bacterium]
MMNDERGVIFDIQRYCVHDGPGIRTTVFLKGCNLRCFWCHNPESYRTGQDLLFYPNKCIACGKCFTLCPLGCHSLTEEGEHRIDRARCTVCGVCAKRCFAGALSLSGKESSVAEVMKTVGADAPFYRNSEGGLTCSGGEPLLQASFVAALLREARAQRIHTALDTAGNVPWEAFEAVLPHTSLVLFDLKCMDPARHREVTGADNGRILENLARLGKGKVPLWVRIPVIPGVNDTEENMVAVAAFLRALPMIRKLELLPYHALGASKHESLGGIYEHKELKAPAKERLQELAGCFAGADFPVTA